VTGSKLERASVFSGFCEEMLIPDRAHADDGDGRHPPIESVRARVGKAASRSARKGSALAIEPRLPALGSQGKPAEAKAWRSHGDTSC